MGDQLSIIRIIAEASIPVQIVIGILLVASLTSWAIIFRKRLVIGRARRGADQFENNFWSGGDLAQLYRAIEQRVWYALLGKPTSRTISRSSLRAGQRRQLRASCAHRDGEGLPGCGCAPFRGRRRDVPMGGSPAWRYAAAVYFHESLRGCPKDSGRS